MMQIPEHVDSASFRAVLSAYTTAYRAIGRQPSVREVWEYWPQIREDAVQDMLLLPEMKAAIEARGIAVATPGLSQTQHLAILALSDPLDKRSTKAKLEAVGATTQEYANWVKNPMFQRARRAQAASLWENALPELQVKMAQQAEAGSFQHQQFILETLGEGPKGREVENAREVVLQLVAAVQKATVGHPEIRKAIMDEMQAVRMAAVAQAELAG